MHPADEKLPIHWGDMACMVIGRGSVFLMVGIFLYGMPGAWWGFIIFWTVIFLIFWALGDIRW